MKSFIYHSSIDDINFYLPRQPGLITRTTFLSAVFYKKILNVYRFCTIDTYLCTRSETLGRAYAHPDNPENGYRQELRLSRSAFVGVIFIAFDLMELIIIFVTVRS